MILYLRLEEPTTEWTCQHEHHCVSVCALGMCGHSDIEICIFEVCCIPAICFVACLSVRMSVCLHACPLASILACPPACSSVYLPSFWHVNIPASMAVYLLAFLLSVLACLTLFWPINMTYLTCIFIESRVFTFFSVTKRRRFMTDSVAKSESNKYLYTFYVNKTNFIFE